MAFRALFAVAAACTLAAGGATAAVYLHSATLAKQADAADAAIQAVDTLKVFDDQIANINNIGAKIDLAIVQGGVESRDLDLAKVLGADTQATPVGKGKAPPQEDADRAAGATLDGMVCARLGAILGGTPCAPPPGGKPQDALARMVVLAEFGPAYVKDWRLVRDASVDVDSGRVAYERSAEAIVKPGETAPDDDCASLIDPKAPSPAAGSRLGALQDACQRQHDFRLKLDDRITGAFPPTSPAETSHLGGLLSSAIAAAAPKPDKPSKEQLSAIDAAIKAAKDAADNSQATAVSDLRDKIDGALKTASDIAKAVGWKHAQDQLSALMTGAVCSADDAKKATAAGVDCKTIVSTATSGQTEAVFNLLSALATFADSKNPNMRSAPWTAAATAMSAAAKADADLKAGAAAASAKLDQQKALVLAKEASLLAHAEVTLRQPDPAKGPAERLRRAMALYAESWNTGRIPADLFDEQALRDFRLTAVRRVQNAATRQHGLILAASGSLKAYADGGVDPAVIAQLLATLGLIGVTAAK